MKQIKTQSDLVEAIRQIVAYSWTDEAADYQEHEEDKDEHIFTVIKALDAWAGKED
jgi:hypothetical protein